MGFYGALFGWVDDPQPWGAGMFYHMQKTNGLEAAAMASSSHWNTYFNVDDVDPVTEKAAQTYGKVLFVSLDVIEAGLMAMLQGRQGAAFGVWQPKGHIGARVKYEPNAVNWNELLTTDPKDAAAFYLGFLGVETGKMPGPMDYTLVKVQEADVVGVMQIISEMGSVPPNWMVYFGVSNADASVAKAES